MKFWYKIILPSSFAELEPNSLSQITKLSDIHSRTEKLKLLFTFRSSALFVCVVGLCKAVLVCVVGWCMVRQCWRLKVTK